jgi:NDP-sugar pyrophosphorylase family protein
MRAMILAAGLGTRLKPLTNVKPKALVEVGEFTMLELAIKYLKKYGFSDIIINVHHFADQVIDYINKHDQFGLNICFSDERTQLLDTGGAIVHASSFFKDSGPFLVMGVDVLTNLDLGKFIQYHLKQKPLVTLAVKERDTTRSLMFDENMQLIGWRDNRSGETRGAQIQDAKYALGFSVIQIIQPEIFNLIIEKGAFPIMELYLRLMETQKIIGFRHSKDIWLEFGRSDRIAEYASSKEFQQITNAF